MLEKQQIKINECGEIVSAEITTIKKVSVEEFCQLYLKDNSEFFNLSPSEFKVLATCMYLSDYYNDKDIPQIGNLVKIDKNFKDICKKKCQKIGDSTIRNAISSLSKKNLLISDKDCKGTYYLNPKYFFKGRLSDRTKAVKHIVEYQFN